MRSAIALAISGYQRFVSPYKGYVCAHNSLWGKGSCSEYGKRVVLRHGTLLFVPLLQRRFAACHAAARVLAEQHDKSRQEVDRCSKQYLGTDVCVNFACCGCTPP
jgi:putative component of membrane protein insertase Oxa1/YidC/SpoIIIJ protein YidD